MATISEGSAMAFAHRFVAKALSLGFIAMLVGTAACESGSAMTTGFNGNDDGGAVDAQTVDGTARSGDANTDAASTCTESTCSDGIAHACGSPTTLDCARIGASCKSFTAGGGGTYQWCDCGSLADGASTCIDAHTQVTCVRGVGALTTCASGLSCASTDASPSSATCSCDDAADGVCPDVRCTNDPDCRACVPNCAGRACGNDGCGGSCGECAPGETCAADGTCPTCTPNCATNMCGDDGCGGLCGTCPTSQTCIAGTCGMPAGGLVTQQFTYVLQTKQFIAYIEDVGSLGDDVEDVELHALANATNLAFSEDPPDGTQGSGQYRVWSEITFQIACTGSTAQIVVSEAATDAGYDGPFAASADPMEYYVWPSGDFYYLASGRPAAETLDTFDAIQERTNTTIWVYIPGHIECDPNGVANVMVDPNRIETTSFPSFRFWASEVANGETVYSNDLLIDTPQGPFSDLWDLPPVPF